MKPKWNIPFIVALSLYILVLSCSSCKLTEMRADNSDKQSKNEEAPSVFPKQIEALYEEGEQHLKGREKEINILRAQKELLLSPNDISIRKKLADISSFSNGKIIAFGIGIPPESARNTSQGKLLAKRAATADAMRWLAYHFKWRENGFEGAMEVTKEVVGAEVTEVIHMKSGACLVRIEAPISANTQ
jgi:hypothetical protein